MRVVRDKRIHEGVGSPVRIALVAASPVHYRAPLYRRLAADPRIEFTAIFASSSGIRPGDQGYGRPVAFDINPLGGYESKFLRRADRNELASPSAFAFTDPDIIGKILREDYEVVWLHGYHAVTFLLAAATQNVRRRPLLISEIATLLNPRPIHVRAAKRILFEVLFRTAHGLYSGEQNRRWFISLGFDERRLSFVPNCVDNARFRQEAEHYAPTRERLKRDLGITSSGPVILMVGRLTVKKQPLFLLDAFRRVRREVPCTLVFAGSGPLESDLHREVDAGRVPDVVVTDFLNQNQISRAYACADVLVLPSRYDETWGLVCNEGMSCGLPVVVTDKVGAANDLGRDGVNGFVVSADEPSELADRLRLLVLDAPLRQRLGSAARESVERFSYEVAARGVLSAVEQTVGPERWAVAVASARRKAIGRAV
jgi:glycosyltransferase involved in cell wall biosynthesis